MSYIYLPKEEAVVYAKATTPNNISFMSLLLLIATCYKLGSFIGFLMRIIGPLQV